MKYSSRYGARWFEGIALWCFITHCCVKIIALSFTVRAAHCPTQKPRGWEVILRPISKMARPACSWRKRVLEYVSTTFKNVKILTLVSCVFRMVFKVEHCSLFDRAWASRQVSYIAPPRLRHEAAAKVWVRVRFNRSRQLTFWWGGGQNSLEKQE